MLKLSDAGVENRVFIPVSRYVNAIEIYQDFPELWSTATVFMVHSMVMRNWAFQWSSSYADL